MKRERVAQLFPLLGSKVTGNRPGRLLGHCPFDCPFCYTTPFLEEVCMPAKTHGMTRDSNGKFTKEYGAWRSMKDRCFNLNNQYYHCYGGRGITVCQEWVDSFQSFLDSVGMAPSPNYSLGRINNDEGYYPGNVAWQTAWQQSNNRRETPRKWYRLEPLVGRILDLHERGFSTRKIADLLGVSKSRVWAVINEERSG